MSKRTVTSICETIKGNKGKNILNISASILFLASMSLCVVAVRSGVILVVVVVMNNSVPPTVQSVSMEDRQRAPSREEGSVLVQPSLEATQDMCGGGCVCMCGIKGIVMYSHSWGWALGGDRETAGRAKGECNEERV